MLRLLPSILVSAMTRSFALDIFIGTTFAVGIVWLIVVGVFAVLTISL